jgi:SAM-dependent methyltransferase
MTPPTATLVQQPNEGLDTNIGEAVDQVYSALLNRCPGTAEREVVVQAISQGQFSFRDFAVRITLQPEFMQLMVSDAQRHHLHALHAARLKLIRWFLPRADHILDVGGANGSMLEYGYPHVFKELILTDIPPKDRIPELQNIDLTHRWADRGNVHVIYTSLTDLSVIPDQSLDLVWVGQVVEHIAEHELKIALGEIHRVLRPGGRFCFDTPNSILTRIHSPHQLIHPEHKKEYEPAELRKLVADFDFSIEEELGMVSMPRTHRTRIFSYEEMVLNTGFSRDLDSCYLIYFCCKRADAATRQ